MVAMNIAVNSDGTVGFNEALFALVRTTLAIPTAGLWWSNLIRRKTDWSENKKEIKLVALRDKKRIKRRENCFCWPKIFCFLKICQNV